VQIPERLYFRIGDVAELVGVKPYVLRYWETEFPIVAPTKSGTGQRVYRRTDVENLLLIKHLLYQERYSIEGAKKRIRELRKEGELKAFREQTLGGESTGLAVESAADADSAEAAKDSGNASSSAEDQGSARQAREARISELKQTARELKQLARTPITKLFDA
jgi:DNA-binding transcriptional MerR regulator